MKKSYPSDTMVKGLSRTAYAAKWRAEHPGRAAASAKRARVKLKQENPAEAKRQRRQWTLAGYGLTPQEFDALLKKQKGRCVICGLLPRGRWTMLGVDHHHGTGKVRGLLCHQCNTGIGFFQENIATLQAAIRYLRRAR